MSNFSFSHCAFKILVMISCKNQGLFGKGLNLMKMAESSQKKEENIVRKGEIARYEQFLLFSLCFRRLVLQARKNQGFFWGEWLKNVWRVRILYFTTATHDLSFISSRAPQLSRYRCALENRRSLVRSPAPPIFFPRIDDSHCDRIHSSLTVVRCFDNGEVEKQPLAWKEYCAEVPVNRTSGKHG